MPSHASQARSPALSPDQTPIPEAAPDLGTEPAAASQGTLGNACLADRAGLAGGGGPTGDALLDLALQICFGDEVDEVEVRSDAGEENTAIGADASTEDGVVSLEDDADVADAESAEQVAHEIAHALATPGTPTDAIDRKGDPGESRAETAGRAFRRWVESGFQGPAPRLRPADGGRAEVHRHPTGTATELTGSPMLRRGSSGALVRLLQTLLNRHGADLDADGEFGPLTDAAVRSFQARNDLEVDGIVGPRTASALNRSGGSSDGGGTDTSGKYAGNDGYSDLRDAVLAAAISHLGAPYYWGADGPTMFDCSGFVLYVLRQDTGLIDWGDDNAHGIMNRLPSTGSPKKGDLVFYWSGGGVQHVEMYSGSGSREIGASGGGSSTRGDNPRAKVQWGDMNDDGRSRTYGSIAGLVEAKGKKRKNAA